MVADETRLKLIEHSALGVFDSWFTEGSVRSKPYDYNISIVTENDLSSRHWFIPGLLPWLGNEPIAGRGEAVRQELLARALVFFLDYTTLLEIKIVNRAVTTIVLDSFGVGFSTAMQMTGLKLYADEAYHAVISAEVSNQVASRYDISDRSACNDRIERLNKLVSDTDESSRELAWFVIGFVSETVITKEFLSVVKSTIVAPVLNVLRDHLEDELKHSQYFSHLFNYVWQCCTDSQRRFIGDFIPKVISTFFKLHDHWLYDNLVQVGVDKFNAKVIHEELQGEDTHRSRIKLGSSATLTALRRSGYLKSPYNIKRLTDVGVLCG